MGWVPPVGGRMPPPCSCCIRIRLRKNALFGLKIVDSGSVASGALGSVIVGAGPPELSSHLPI